MKLDFSDRFVVVTGGSRGIGAACCQQFSEAGATVLVHYRENRAAAEAVRSRLASSAGGEHLSHAADLSRANDVNGLFEFLGGKWDRIDVLVNNAGIWKENPMRRLEEGDLEETIGLNLRGVFLTTGRAVPLLTGADSNIVNVSSTAGQRGEARYSPYAASKGAVIAATKSWAVELAPQIRVNAVAPGWVDTDMCREPFAEGGRARIESEIPLRRVASADDVAAAIVFLASAQARHITGEILNVNGGSVLCG